MFRIVTYMSEARTTTATDTFSDDLYSEIIAELCEAGFEPLPDLECDDVLANEHPKAYLTAEYFMQRGWDAYRYERRDGGFTFCRFSEDGIDLAATTESGVFASEAHFNMNARGVAWMAAALKA